MKNKKSIIHLIEVACACLILLGPALIFAGDKSGGHVMVNRVANFGTDLSLSVSVDGSEVANLPERSKLRWLFASRQACHLRGGFSKW